MQDTSERLEMVCPLNGKICIAGRRADFPTDKLGNLLQCRFWVHLYGKDPQSEKTLDQWDCAISWIPVLQTEVAQMERHTTASVDKLANIMNEAKGSIDRLTGTARYMMGIIHDRDEKERKFLTEFETIGPVKQRPIEIKREETNEDDKRAE